MIIDLIEALRHEKKIEKEFAANVAARLDVHIDNLERQIEEQEGLAQKLGAELVAARKLLDIMDIQAGNARDIAENLLRQRQDLLIMKAWLADESVKKAQSLACILGDAPPAADHSGETTEMVTQMDIGAQDCGKGQP